MARRGRRRVIEGNERLLLITPCLLSGVHTCFRNILPAVYNQATALYSGEREIERTYAFKGVPTRYSWILPHTRARARAHIHAREYIRYSYTRLLCTAPKVSTKPCAEALACVRERGDNKRDRERQKGSSLDRSTSCRSPTTMMTRRR